MSHKSDTAAVSAIHRFVPVRTSKVCHRQIQNKNGGGRKEGRKEAWLTHTEHMYCVGEKWRPPVLFCSLQYFFYCKTRNVTLCTKLITHTALACIILASGMLRDNR
jgi:hypothetical protein